MKNKQLRKWALSAELISAIAVIVTLVFVIIGMKENTNAMQAQTFQELMRDVNNWRSSIRSLERDQTMSTLRSEGFDSLSESQQVLVRLIFLELWGIYEAAFFANERGVLGSDEWARFERMICVQRRGDVEIHWDREYEGLFSYRNLLTPTFVEYVEAECQESANVRSAFDPK